jgi:hypothetical protein
MSYASATDLGVQIIPKDSETEVVSLDNVKLGETYTIDGYARIKPVSFKIQDTFPQFDAGAAGNREIKSRYYSKDLKDNVMYSSYYDDQRTSNSDEYYQRIRWMNSMTEAEFAYFCVDITNLAKSDAEFTKGTTVKVLYADEYEYTGWVRQFNYDYDTNRKYAESSGYGLFIRAALDPGDVYPIGMVYSGHYAFGCTLPNTVVEDESASLKMIITLGGNEITYWIRK